MRAAVRLVFFASLGSGLAQANAEFEQDIRPVLESRCASCHSAAARQGGLAVDTVDNLLRGGANGAVIVAGHSDRSPLVLRLRGSSQPRMPMGGKPLADAEIERIAKWIDAMPVRPGTPQAGAKSQGNKKLGWPWIKPAEPAVPAVKSKEWVRNPIDAFVLSKLEEKGLTPAPPVSRRGSYRRLHFALLGMPPKPEEMKRFLDDASPDAYRNEVERLLEDQRYGEKWGRHWLDLVRYSDTKGGAIDYPRPHMWRYRDYVIRAFNQDRPYDRFIKEQLAGDAFPAFGSEGRLGLAFLSQWVQVEQVEREMLRRDFMVDLVDTTASVFLGLTLGCARCHDHKYDPLPTKDYYRLEAFFTPMTVDVAEVPFHQYEAAKLDPERWERSSKQWKGTLEAREKAQADFRKGINERVEQHRILFGSQDLKDWAEPGQRKYSIPGDMLTSKEEKARQKLIGRQTARFANPNSPDYYLPKAHVVADSDELKDVVATKVLAGGNYKLAGEEVKPGYLSAIAGNMDPVNLDGLGGTRRQLLAKWIASPDNPLTARVMVNRIWQYHFGRGLVATPSDFGKNGGGALHPELLDWLALRFVESGWSVKEIQRLIVNSNVYHLGMNHPQAEAAGKIDPDNKLFWMRDPIRIEVESIRDSMLAVSGQLNPVMGGPPYFPVANDEQMARAPTWWEPSEVKERSRRTVYMLQSRSFQLPFIKVFDGANMDQTCVVRGVTSVTPQVFALFNNEFSHAQSVEMAKRVAAEAGPEPDKQVQRAFQLAFQRDPSGSEREMSMKFLRRAETKPLGNLADLSLVLFNMNEFIFLD
ncbi:MAG: DUF1553 domain-containing protein [Acidobacteria bacterium]|nr:DUF1553 domain-containing protein [Acidobacteriota bacterium]